ncbi:bifunctional adenosylcobinamide kinase/adenosylcobinamide-phosphate guanylyltransferase [Neptunomonas japonica]|uniref:Bifunctional adenosylcobalamin biosynthesis protein n=1 Tax=Neptunomonas japonica JAMM 1380 TaxID=1441457 RepID=A0A7R6P9L1_9GAMM|nr:bifunctional adenosylcobinamide kinase/adenosylcobinamide-phosphate guanylyltransferase [Neptunomonas japonica]BBB29779.1 adenosylcobinamide kinase/adenosylcobinamide-phosphate guanylyltransferase [Neptunomonas japonica JAMM 1380]
MIHFIIGGARSGKSSYAENLAGNSGAEVIYIATAQAYDDEMQERIQQHKHQRPSQWDTFEEPIEIGNVINDKSSPTNCLLIDCLTLWVTNLLCENKNMADYKQQLVDALSNVKGDVILVSNETGMGVVPMGELTRRYCDEAGWLHQEIAALADQVVLMVAGIPVVIKHISSHHQHKS